MQWSKTIWDVPSLQVQGPPFLLPVLITELHWLVEQQIKTNAFYQFRFHYPLIIYLTFRYFYVKYVWTIYLLEAENPKTGRLDIAWKCLFSLHLSFWR